MLVNRSYGELGSDYVPRAADVRAARRVGRRARGYPANTRPRAHAYVVRHTSDELYSHEITLFISRCTVILYIRTLPCTRILLFIYLYVLCARTRRFGDLVTMACRCFVRAAPQCSCALSPPSVHFNSSFTFVDLLMVTGLVAELVAAGGLRVAADVRRSARVRARTRHVELVPEYSAVAGI